MSWLPYKEKTAERWRGADSGELNTGGTVSVWGAEASEALSEKERKTNRDEEKRSLEVTHFK